MSAAAAKQVWTRENQFSQPVGSALRVFKERAEGQRGREPERIYNDLHIKGLLEGVPSNTERAAVKPRAGIAR